MKLDGKLVLITGASSGIGAEIAAATAARGARVLLVARSADKLAELAGRIEADRGAGTAAVHPADLSEPEDVARLAAEVLAGPGLPDVLINNAGAGRWRAIDELERGEVHQATALPYLAAYDLTRELIEPMIARGSGHILNITSLAGYLRIPGASAYAIARWAMRAFSYHLAEDLRETGVGVSLLAPAEVDSPYFDNNPGSRERIPRIGRLIGEITPAEVAAEAVASIERERSERIIPWRARWLLRLTAEPVMRALVTRTGWQREG